MHAVWQAIRAPLQPRSLSILYVLPRCLCFPNSHKIAPADSAIEYQTVRYNITPTQEQTEYIGYGPDVDRAWNHITYDVGDQMISHDELHRLGLDPASLKIKDPKSGEEGYRVGIQVFHQLHCLNLLRQDSYKEYYSHHGGDIEVQPEDLRGHLGAFFSIPRSSQVLTEQTIASKSSG